jgi:benzil reductase ((S)-benzoin forming)
MEQLCQADADTFTAVQRLQQARATETMPTPQQAAEDILEVLPRLRERPSGSFIDIREILQPALYASLFGKR